MKNFLMFVGILIIGTSTLCRANNVNLVNINGWGFLNSKYTGQLNTFEKAGPVIERILQRDPATMDEYLANVPGVTHEEIVDGFYQQLTGMKKRDPSVRANWVTTEEAVQMLREMKPVQATAETWTQYQSMWITDNGKTGYWIPRNRQTGQMRLDDIILYWNGTPFISLWCFNLIIPTKLVTPETSTTTTKQYDQLTETPYVPPNQSGGYQYGEGFRTGGSSAVNNNNVYILPPPQQQQQPVQQAYYTPPQQQQPIIIQQEKKGGDFWKYAGGALLGGLTVWGVDKLLDGHKQNVRYPNTFNYGGYQQDFQGPSGYYNGGDFQGPSGNGVRTGYQNGYQNTGYSNGYQNGYQQPPPRITYSNGNSGGGGGNQWLTYN